MKQFIPVILLLSILAASSAVAQNSPTSAGTSEARSWTIDPTHSRIGFKARHFGIASVSGQFRDFATTLSVDPGDVSTLEATATVQTGSVDTGNDRRDNHLRSDDFFNAEQFPELTFVSKQVRPGDDDGSFELVGDLTIRETTKEVVLTGQIVGTAEIRGRQVMAIEAETTINRFDYGLKFDRVTEAGGLVVGEDVRIILEVEASRQ